jgi:hypothetical protein
MPILGIMASQISGHLWQPEGAYDSLATVTLSATTSSITFAGIPAGYKHLQLRGNIQMASTSDMNIQFNGDTSATYAYHALYGSGASATALSATSTANGAYCGYFNSGSSSFAGMVIDILDYQNTNKNKVTRTLEGNDSNGSGFVFLASGLWQSTSAITSIKFFSKDAINLNTNSTLSLYGIK